MSPERGGATGPPSTGPLFFVFQRPRCKFKEKKIHLGPVALWGATGGIFEIFQNGHIFLNFLFLKNIKKKKASELGRRIRLAPQVFHILGLKLAQ